MAKDLLHSISEGMSGFSKGQKLIARYIIENYDKAAFMTASRLGSTVGVSESTVVRFAAELGYDGYPDMQKSLQKMIRNRLTSVQRIEVTNDRIGDQDLLSMVLQSDIEKIRLTLEELDRDHFEKAVDAIVARLFFAVCMDAAACHHHHIGPFADVEIVVYQVVHAAVCDAGRDIYLFPFCAGRHADIDARLVCFGFNFDVFRRLAPGASAVLANVVGAGKFALKTCHQAQQFIRYLIHARRTSFCRRSSRLTVSSTAAEMARLTCTQRKA